MQQQEDMLTLQLHDHTEDLTLQNVNVPILTSSRTPPVNDESILNDQTLPEEHSAPDQQFQLSKSTILIEDTCKQIAVEDCDGNDGNNDHFTKSDIDSLLASPSAPPLVVQPTPAQNTINFDYTKCQFYPFQYISNDDTIEDDETVCTLIKGLTQFHQFGNIDVNYQGENIHAMFNEDKTYIIPAIENFDLSSFRDRRGRVFYVTDLNPMVSGTNGTASVVVVVAWKKNVKDTFGLLLILSFEEYFCGLENKYAYLNYYIVFSDAY